MAIYPDAQSPNRSLSWKDSMFHTSFAPRPCHVCHANGLSHRPSSAPSQFIPVYTADDDELAGALERVNQEVNQEVNPGLIPLPIFLESHLRVCSVPTRDKI